MIKWTLGQIGKTKPIQSQFKPNSKPIQTQTNPISGTYYKQMTNQSLTKLFVDSLLPILPFNCRQVVDNKMLSWYCNIRNVPQYFSEVDMENKANNHP
jgi:hypothetical protein